MAFQIIQNDAGTPAEVSDAINLLNRCGYDIKARPTGKLLVTLEDTDNEFMAFMSKYVTQISSSFTFTSFLCHIRGAGIKVNYVDLQLIDFIAEQVAAARQDRSLRHAIIWKYFGAQSSHDLYRNLAGFSKAFDHFDVNASYTVRLV